MAGDTVANTQLLGVGDIFRVFYARLRGESFREDDFRHAIEQWQRPGQVSLQHFEPHEQGGIAGYYAFVLVKEPGTVPDLFVPFIVTAQSGEPGYGEFRRVEVKKVAHRAGFLVDAEKAWDRMVGWLVTGDAAEDVVGVVSDVGSSAGRVAGGTARGAVEEFGPVRSGLVVLGGLAAGAWLLSRTL